MRNAKLKSVAKSDILICLSTASRIGGKNLVEGSLDPRARVILKKAFSGATRVFNEVKKGPEKISIDEAKGLYRKVYGVQNTIRNAWTEIRQHCQGKGKK